MEKKSIGTFLAALRKASGYTQEEVAQRLFVSNKTISKWERDESSPDLAAIPVLAELFSVTCDEILRGERMPQGAQDEGKGRPKAEKQAQHMANSTINLFKSVSGMAIGLTLVGLIAHFVIAYTYFKPLVAFGLALLFLLGSTLMEYLQLNYAKTALKDSPLLSEADVQPGALIKRLHRAAFFVFLCNAWAFLLILPMVMAEGLDFANGVLRFGTYLGKLPLQVLLCLAVTAAAMHFLRNWLGIAFNKSGAFSPLLYTTKAIQRLMWIQAALLLGTVLCFVAPILYTLSQGGISQGVMIPFVILTLLCPVGCVVTLILWLRKGHKGLERFVILLLSARNFLLTVTALLALKYVGTYVSTADPVPRLSLPSAYAWNNLVLQWMLIIAAYLLLKYVLVKRLSGKNTPPPAPLESGT